MEDSLPFRTPSDSVRLQHFWEFEDVELQYEKSRRRNQWKFLNGVKADNQYEKDGLRDYHIWSGLRGFSRYSEPFSSRKADCDVVADDAGNGNSANIAVLFPSVAKSPGLPNLPNAVVHQIIGYYAKRVVDRGSEKEKNKYKSEDTDTLTLPKEVVNQILGEYAEKAVDKGSKKEKKKSKKDKKKLAAEDETEVAPDNERDTGTVWERHLRILMSEFSMPRDKAERVMNQARGEPFEAVRIVGEEVKGTMASLANQISKKEAIKLHIQAGWSASELRKAKQHWLAKAGIPRDMQRLILAGKIAN